MARKVSSQAAASYDLAMAQHMLASGEFEKLKMHLETMKAGADCPPGRADARSAEHDAAAKHHESRNVVNRGWQIFSGDVVIH